MKSILTTRVCLLLSIVTFFVSSCAVHNGIFESGVAITNNQFRVVGVAEGKASTTYILGFGGLSKDALVLEAKRDLYSRYPLTKGMVLANVTVDFKRTYAFVAAATLVTISADVIDFNPSTIDFQYKGFYTDDSTFFPMTSLPILSELRPNILDRDFHYLKKGENVVFKINNSEMKGVIEDINSFGIKCSYQTNSGQKKIYLKSENLKTIK